MWQRLQEWARTDALAVDQANGFTDEELKAQVSQNADHAKNLIDIENARAANKLKMVALVGLLALAVVVVVTGAALFVVEAAGDLHLPWSSIGTAVMSLFGSSGAAFIAWRVLRALRGRREAAASAVNPREGRAEDDQNAVGTQ
ncbi:hypothetical protein OG762_42790 [Streptomyces sp. NBC_01136]|nr:hypothetical protein OG762_42790 [Streptomyces sp. NBC_01136]